MKYCICTIGIFLMAALIGCSSSENTVSDTNNSAEQEIVPDERISLHINEYIYFEFVKIDSAWSGEFTTYQLNDEGEKTATAKYLSAQDSSWNDFDLFVDFLNIYEIPPQHEIDGWVPDSGQLPRRVYSFKIFDGDTTRSFSYQDPVNDLRDFWQSQNVLTFVTFVENDLRWVEKEDKEH